MRQIEKSPVGEWNLEQPGGSTREMFANFRHPLTVHNQEQKNYGSHTAAVLLSIVLHDILAWLRSATTREKMDFKPTLFSSSSPLLFDTWLDCSLSQAQPVGCAAEQNIVNTSC
jgi:hypothetical protein